ncbi:MAG: hypothetical protein QOJ19_4200 [Acidimicrobiia bacterium]|nr:hypothetical protein [Acidimicrobiia bacterium]
MSLRAPWRRSDGAPSRQGDASRLQLRVHPGGLAALAGLVVAARIPALAPGVGPGFALLAALAGALVLDTGCSIVALRRRGLRVVANCSADATVGERAPVRLEVLGRRAALLVRLASVREAEWVRVDAPGGGEFPTTPERRGRFGAIQVSLQHSAPFGLIGAIRTVSVPLSPPILVGPRPAAVDEPPYPGSLTEFDAELARLAATDGELVRGARPYVPGDDARRVHWPLTARTGQLMVRELDAVHRPSVLLVVDLGPVPGDEAEAAAELAAGVAGRVLQAGFPLVLVTREDVGRCVAPAGSALQVGRRLAVAETGDRPPAADVLPEGTPYLVVGVGGSRWVGRS